ncbi:hypothetical protein B0H14DRAFT_3422538 [Mycena olivaceomarginata]|nr:hypothetical protein B0H14DRAFT_3422538 [Mycena olivaceomarginata]
MIYTSSKPASTTIPQLDLLSFLFESPESLATETTVLHAEAANPTEGITKAQARVLTRRIAHTLRTRFGIGQHGSGKDVVVVMSTGQYLLPILFYGILAAGGVASFASSSFRPEELARQIKQGSAKLCISCPNSQDILLSAARLADFPLHRSLVFDSSQPQGRLRMLTADSSDSAKSVIGEFELDWERITNKEELENSLICLLYSSGTTGAPKGVKLSHTNMVAEACIGGEGGREHWETKEKWDYRTLAHLPTAHIAGVEGYFVIPFYMGGTTFWMPKFDFAQFLEYNRSLEITTFFSVPPIYLLCAKSPLVKDHFRSLKAAIGGAAPLGKNLQIEVSKKLGVFLAQTWGLSETTGSASGGEINIEDLSGSVGPLFPHINARHVEAPHPAILLANRLLRIIDDDGNDCAPGTPGEVLVQGPIVTKGYFNNPEANAGSFKDGFLCTGDIGFIKDGRVFIVDRKKELIKYKGLQVAPAELEALLISHPHILDAGVIGIFDEELATEVPRAYVVADQAVISAAAIKDFVKSRLASHKQLRGGVEFVPCHPEVSSRKDFKKGSPSNGE